MDKTIIVPMTEAQAYWEANIAAEDRQTEIELEALDEVLFKYNRRQIGINDVFEYLYKCAEEPCVAMLDLEATARSIIIGKYN